MSATDLARDLVRVIGKQAGEHVARAPGQSELGRVVRANPLMIQAQSFTIPLTSADVVVAMGTPLSQGAMVHLIPTKGGTWAVVPLQDAPMSLSSDPTQRAGTAYDPSGSGAAQSGTVGTDPLYGPDGRVIGSASQYLPSGNVTVTQGAGRVVGQPKDRPGMTTSRSVLIFVQKIADVWVTMPGGRGQTITLGTGTNHNQYVAGTNNTRQSAHWTGHAIDLPMSGAKLTSLGQAALTAAGMPRSEALGKGGGVFNINGWNILYNTYTGGNHYTHLHVGEKA